MPLLGVCRGMQVLNVACGGTLDQHIPDRLGHEIHRPVPGAWAEHEVRIEPGSLAAEAAGTERLTVKSHHHQGIDRIADKLTATAWATDDETVEAIESGDGSFALGVLWHPEEDRDGRDHPGAYLARRRVVPNAAAARTGGRDHRPRHKGPRCTRRLLHRRSAQEGAEATVLGAAALGGVGAGVIGSLTELPEMLPAERRVEAEREESWRTTEHERWREFVRATEALDPH